MTQLRTRILRLALPIALALSCHAANADDLRLDRAWARAATTGAASTAAYVRIVNQGSRPDRLLAVSAAIAERAELHEQRADNGVMRMRRVPALSIAAGATVEMQPLGGHVMLLGLRKPLSAGDTIALVLRFEQAGERVVQATVEPVDFLPAAEHRHHH